MNVQELLQVYAADERLKRAAEKYFPSNGQGNGDPVCLLFDGLIGSAAAVVAASFHTLTRHAILFVMADKEQAAYFQNDLQTFFPR